MRRFFIALIAIMMALQLPAAEFTDSLGRTAELPDKIERIVPSGNLAQLVLYSIAPERIVGWSSKLSGSDPRYAIVASGSMPLFRRSSLWPLCSDMTYTILFVLSR